MERKMSKIYLNKMAQKMLFGYLEGVDWQIDLCEIDPNDKSDNPKYIFLPEKEQNRIHDKVTNWTHEYKKKYNGEYSEIKLDNEVNFYLNIDSESQISLIDSEVLDPSNDVEDIFEAYMSTNGREYDRIKKGKESLFNEYVLAKKQLNKLAKLTKQPTPRERLKQQ
jgi:hypothetical protein|tara:strand:+ start:45 stop:542 length:498 start_codon:yes stop_codon:yes gene_type:complete